MTQLDPPIRDLFDLFDHIERRPAMWVGYDEHTWNSRFIALEAMIAGYEIALGAHGVDEPGVDFHGEFRSYLRARFGWSVTAGAIAAVRRQASDDADAWRQFWQLVREFRAERSRG